jgi:hypothetical protein
MGRGEVMPAGVRDAQSKVKVEERKVKEVASMFFPSASVNSTGAVCDQKTSKFFVSHWEESMAGHVGINGVY